MMIIEKNYNFSSLEKRSETKFIIIHHAASKKCTPDDIHKIHQSNGWAGIGYHFFVSKEGIVYSARPLWAAGAHTIGKNDESVGICFEGNFEREEMNEKQLCAGIELLRYLKGKYTNVHIKKHSDFNSTVCPGKNFPFCEMIPEEIESESDIVSILAERKIMTNLPLWKEKLKNKSNAYYLAKNICEKTTDATMRKIPLESVNDIVWELSHRQIITDKNLWLNLFEKDKDLYWLGYKAVNMTK